MDLEALIGQFLFSSDDLRAPTARDKNKLADKPDEIIETQTVPEAQKEADVLHEELKKLASIDNFSDDGSMDFLLPPLATPTGGEEFLADREKRLGVKPIRLYEDMELDEVIASGPENPNYNNAWNERLLRERWEGQSFWENVRDPDYIKRKGGNIIQQFTSGPARIPGQVATLGGLVTALPELGAKEVGLTDDMAITDALLEAGAEYNQEVNEFFGMNDPENPAEMAASILSPSLIRVPVKAPTSLVGNIAEVATPLTIGGGAKRTAANFGTQFLGHEALRPVIAPEGDEYETIFQQLISPTQAEAQTSDPELDFEVGVNPENGVKLKNSDYLKLGIFGALTVGLGVAPRVVQAWQKTPMNTSKFVDETGVTAPKPLQSIETSKDLITTYISSPIKGLEKIMKRAGVDQQKLFDAIETDTNSALGQKVNAGIEVGGMRTLDGDYKVKTSAFKLRKVYDALPDQQKVYLNRYTELMDTLDDMNIYKKNLINGISRRRLTEELARLKRAYPDITKVHKVYTDLQKANLEFASKGKFALFTRKKYTELKANRKNYVPWEIEDVDPTLPASVRASRRANIYGSRTTGADESTPFLMRRDPGDGHNHKQRVDAYDLMIRSTENILRAKTLNAVRGQIIDALRSSKVKGLAVRVSNADLEKNPAWKQRSVTIRRRGQRENYVLSQGLADILRFDPNFAKYPSLFGFSRAFQFGTTGYGAPWFAVKHFIRDTIASTALSPKGFKPLATGMIPGTGAARSFSALGSQLYWQTVKGLSNWFNKQAHLGSASMLQRVLGLDDMSMRAISDNLADSYLRSMHHLFTREGGLNVNMAHNAYRQGQTALGEIAKSVDVPPSVSGMARTWKNIIDSIQNAPHYAWLSRNKKWMEKNLGRGLNKTELKKLIKEERELTGNVTDAGKVYTRDGRVIGTNKYGGDVVDEGLLSAAAPAIGRTIQVFREGSPWTNALISGLRKTGRAYWENPWGTIGRMYGMLFIPTTLSYFTAASMGEPYLTHMLMRRSEYDKSTNVYIPPFWGEAGKVNPEDGLEIPVPLEIAPVMYMYLNLLDQIFRPDATHTQIGEIANTVMGNFFGLTMPPAAQAAAGLSGVKLPGTIPGFGETSYIPKDNAYSPFPGNIELALRGAFGSSADLYMAGVMSFLEEGDIAAGLNEMAYRAKQKTPLIQNKQLHSFTDITERDFQLGDKLREFEEIYDAWTIDPMTGETVPKPVKQKEDKPIYTYGEDESLIREDKPYILKSGKESTSRTEEDISGEAFGSLPTTVMGLPTVPAPTNPIYLHAAEKLHTYFESKGYNYQRARSILSTATKQVRSLKRLNSGNLEKWKEEVEELPDSDPTKEFLMELDLSSRDSVRVAINQLEKVRTQVRSIVELYVEEVQDQLQAELQTQGVLPQGQELDLLALDPYAAAQ